MYFVALRSGVFFLGVVYLLLKGTHFEIYLVEKTIVDYEAETATGA